MDLEIYEQQEEIVKEPTRLAFEKLGYGVSVIAVDHNGKKLTAGNLVTFHADDKIILHTAVDYELGFDLNEKGQIRVR